MIRLLGSKRGKNPAYESGREGKHTKIDSIKFKIEQLCRLYTGADERNKKKIETDISYYRAELEYLYQKNMKNGSKSSLYNANLVIPCLFNSGCIIGKRGMASNDVYYKQNMHLSGTGKRA